MFNIKENMNVIAGREDLQINRRPLKPFEEVVCNFLNKLSSELMSEPEARPFPDVISFAFWCRTSNIIKLKEQFSDPHIRLGRGYVFHIAPSNVPINFAFSFAFSLLAGNANIVRVPSKEFTQTAIVIRAITRLFKDNKYKAIADRTAFIRYAHDNEITRVLSADCSARIVWGGDETINKIKQLPIPVRSIEVSFADRYSFCVIDSKSILKADDAELKRLASNFYNDTFLMDQNACSSPHLIVWLGNSEDANRAKERFWHTVYEFTSTKYELQPVNAVDKYTTLCRNAIDLDDIATFTKYGNYIYCVQLNELPANIDRWRGKYGFFYEFDTEDLSSTEHIVNSKYQTLTYYGTDKRLLVDFVLDHGLSGIDRIVPIGSALDISIIWDGYDLIRTLSRICDVK